MKSPPFPLRNTLFQHDDAVCPSFLCPLLAHWLWKDEERGAGACMCDVPLPITALCFGVQDIWIGFDVIGGHG